MNKQVIRAKVQLMLNKPFFGALAARLELQDFDGNTFATDGKRLLVPADKHYTYSPKELESVVAHEVLHCAFLHFCRKGTRDHRKWNIAGDYAINWILKQDGFPIHQSWLLDEKYAGMSAEKIYSLLPDQEGGEGGQGGEGGAGTNSRKGKQPQLPKDMNDLQEGQDQDGGKDNSDLEGEWKDAVAHAADKSQGKLPAGFEEFIKDFLSPKIPWQQTLMRFLQASKGTNDFCSYPFNRAHIHRGIYLPSMDGERIELVCAIDTSGSIGEDEFRAFLGETCGIARAFGEFVIHFMQCDAKVQDYTVIESEQDIPNKMKGRGGTDFRPVFAKVDELELTGLPIVYFTDLCGTFPTEPVDNTYWVVKSEYAKSYKAPWGDTIELD